MENREKILTQLYIILEKNKADARIYYRLADKCKRAFLKNFFKKISYQKRIYCRRISYEIRELETALTNKVGFDLHSQLSNPGTFHGFPSLKTDTNGFLKYCYKKEQEYFTLYKSLLSITHLGDIREMLINQKHSAQLVLNEIKTMQSKIQPGRMEGEVNYSRFYQYAKFQPDK